MKPALMVVDDDPQMLIALVRDLEKEYGNRFRILQADSGENALELMNQLKLRNEVSEVHDYSSDFHLKLARRRFVLTMRTSYEK